MDARRPRRARRHLDNRRGGRQIEIGSHGIAGNLAAAGQDAQRIPVVGDALSNPITAASQAALDIAAPATTWTPRPAGLR